MGTQLNFDELLNKKSGYGPTLDEYIDEYTRLNKEFPSYRALKAAGFGDSKHNFRVILEQKAKTSKLPIPVDFEDNYNSEKVITKSNYSAEESNYDSDFSKEFSKAFNYILTKFKKPQLELLKLLSDGKPKTNDFLISTLQISKPTLYSWFKQISEYFPIKKEIKSEGRGRPRAYYSIDFSLLLVQLDKNLRLNSGDFSKLLVKFNQNTLLNSDDSDFSKEFSKALNYILTKFDDNTNIEHSLNVQYNFQNNTHLRPSFPNGLIPIIDIPKTYRELFQLLMGVAYNRSRGGDGSVPGESLLKDTVTHFEKFKKQITCQDTPYSWLGGPIVEFVGGVPLFYMKIDDQYFAFSCIEQIRQLDAFKEVEPGVFRRRK